MKTISTFVIAVLVMGFLFLSLPQQSHAGGGGGVLVGCCINQSGCVEFAPPDETVCAAESVILNGICVPGEGEFGECVPGPNTVPTLSEWGLIATAAVLGFIGFIAIRRRKATA